jgi:hypothetical protein
MSRSSRRSPRPPSTKPAAAEPARALLNQSDALGEALFRYRQAVYGFADLLAFVASNEGSGPSGASIEGWSQLAWILADEGKRIDEAFGHFDDDMRRAVRPTGGER